jgi:hypothetical protein
MVTPTNERPDTPNASERGAPAPLNEKARRLLQEAVAALDKGAREEAVRLFLQGAAHGLIPEDPHLAQTLAEAIGKEAATRLIEALAVQPCFYCNRGHDVCEACGGSGRSAVFGICDRCLGLGQAFCDFCNGSGWTAIDFVPAGLRRAVVLARVRLAIAKIKGLIEQPLPAADSADLRQTGHACAALLVALNRNMGVLENAVIALKESIPAAFVTPETTAKVTETCTRAAPLLDKRMRQVLGVMAEVARRQGLNASTEEGRELTRHAAGFYERLASDSFGLTKLEHPFVHRATSGGGRTPER